MLFPNLAPQDLHAAAEDSALRAGTLDAAKLSVFLTGLAPQSASVVGSPFRSSVPLSVAHYGKPSVPRTLETLTLVGWTLEKVASVRRACEGITVVSWIYWSGLQRHCIAKNQSCFPPHLCVGLLLLVALAFAWQAWHGIGTVLALVARLVS